MADSLSELSQQVDAARGEPLRVTISYPTDTPKKAAPETAPEPGDAVMVKAQGLQDLNDEEKSYVKLFQSSNDLVMSKIQADPVFKAAIEKKIQPLQGENLAHAIIDAADEIRIDYLKKTEPTLFTADDAAKTAFFNTVTFGQLSRIIGGADQLINGRPWKETAEQQGERARLLQKAFPKSNLFGQAVGFMVPGSPVKAVFEKAAGIGAKGAGAIIDRLVSNPGLLAKVAQSATAGAAGGAAIGGIEGGLGSGTDAISFDRAGDKALSNAIGGGVFGGALPLATAGASKAAEVAAPYVRSAAKGMVRNIEGLVESLSGTSKTALRAYNKDPGALRRAFGTEKEIGENLVDHLLSLKRSQLPEVKLAEDLLPNLPDVPANPVVKFLRSFGTGRDPKLDPQIKILHEWADRIEAGFPTTQIPGPAKTIQTSALDSSFGANTATAREMISVPVTRANPNARIAATAMRDVVDDLQTASAEQYGKESPFLADKLKQAARIARMSIADTAAKQGGEAGKTYNELMAKASEKRSVLKFLMKRLGTNPETMEGRAEGFVRNLFGANKTAVEGAMARLDEKFGTNFLEQARAAKNARALWPQLPTNAKPGNLPLVSSHATGKAVAGVVTGGAVGGVPGAIAGAALGSPRAGAMLLGASDNISGFVRKMVANPEALKRIAGNASNALEIRRVAQELGNTLVKDGPISAGSLTRVVADTPFFIGLVHAFDVAERSQEASTGRSALSKMQSAQENQNIATPRQ